MADPKAKPKRVFRKLDPIESLGYKLTHRDKTHNYYGIFDTFQINLKVSNDLKTFEITHDREFPEQELIETKTQEFSENATPIVTIDRLTKYIIECIKDDEYQFNNPEDKQPDIVETKIPIIKHDKDRELLIVVWGNKRSNYDDLRTKHNLQKNYSAMHLRGSRRFRDDARNDDVYRSVQTNKGFIEFLESTIPSIEAENLNRIGINCSKGRHRSVTCARSLKEYYYPKATIIYANLK
ncbi:MAG: RNase adaptor protein [Edafosvirus sp.]|uniref:RNase adaptor protein n=1 Tax=Edafosvirus sp. TaxID=2487765 RepID=A0A3G4ZZF9_9VIRU|nr:MAG: RNase adaptor protein [Edafosvirus sp.]